MDIIEAILARKSIRSYKPDPIPRKILEGILDIAIHAPSTMNSQPWEISIVSGTVLDNIRKNNIEMLKSESPSRSETSYTPFHGKYRQRQVELAKQIFNLMGITREDKIERAAWMQRGFRFFDAPAVFIISLDRSLDESALNLLDIGAIMQTICLVALNYGLGTCINDQGIMFPDVIRKYTHLSKSQRMIICIAIGYPEWDFPANQLKSHREEVKNITTWYI